MKCRDLPLVEMSEHTREHGSLVELPWKSNIYLVLEKRGSNYTRMRALLSRAHCASNSALGTLSPILTLTAVPGFVSSYPFSFSLYFYTSFDAE